MWNVRAGGTTAAENAATPSESLGTTAVCISGCNASYGASFVLCVLGVIGERVKWVGKKKKMPSPCEKP